MRVVEQERSCKFEEIADSFHFQGSSSTRRPNTFPLASSCLVFHLFPSSNTFIVPSDSLHRSELLWHLIFQPIDTLTPHTKESIRAALFRPAIPLFFSVIY